MKFAVFVRLWRPGLAAFFTAVLLIFTSNWSGSFLGGFKKPAAATLSQFGLQLGPAGIELVHHFLCPLELGMSFKEPCRIACD